MRVDRDGFRFAGVLAGVVLLIAAGIYVPARIERGGLADRVVAAERDLIGGEAEAEEVRRLQVQVGSLRETTTRPQRYVPRQDELAEVLRGVTASTTGGDVRVRELVVDEPLAFRDYSVIPVRLRFEGGFPGVFGVLDRLESMPRLIRFDDLKIVTKGGRAPAPAKTVDVDLRLSAFFSPDAEESQP